MEREKVAGDFRSLFLQKLWEIYKQKATGELSFSCEGGRLKTAFFLRGFLQYFIDSEHRVRRFRRALGKQTEDITTWAQYADNSDFHPVWESRCLREMVSKKLIPLEAAKSVIAEVARECILELLLSGRVVVSWQDRGEIHSTLSFFLSLTPSEIEGLLKEAETLYETLGKQTTNGIMPTLAPTLSEKGQGTIKDTTQRQYLNGEFTLWDVAKTMRLPLPRVMESLKKWEENGLIVLSPIPDLPLSLETNSNTLPVDSFSEVRHRNTTNSKPGRFLIACIDDSPIVLHTLKKILEGAGFATLLISEPMRGLGKILEHKPDLIILDLNLPNASGHSVCRFLRESPVFQNTPIIILSAKDGTLDKTKAKLAGATDFIPKPPVADKLIATVNRYLQPVMARQSGMV